MQEASARRIFIVEDESLVRMLVEEAIAEIGGVVAGAASTVENALELMAELSFDAAVIDINLRGEMSFAVADALAARGVPFAFTTGYDAGEIPERFRDRPLLQKPFQLAELERVLKRLPDARAG